MEFQNIAVVGAGVIGRGVAQVLAKAGHQVALVDVTDRVLTQALREIRLSICSECLLGPRSVNSPDKILERITTTTDIASPSVTAADIVIENVTEKWEVKRAVYESLELNTTDRVYAVNTSCYPIDRIASLLRRPDTAVGVHFMNPAPLRPTVEVVRGPRTSERTLAQILRLIASLRKSAVVVGDGPGFVCNRVLMLAINEAVNTVADGVAPAKAVDQIFRECLGHSMGPLETADLIGLDTILYSLEVLHDAFGGDRFAASPLLRQMVNAGQLGRKSGSGFFSYLATSTPALLSSLSRPQLGIHADQTT